MPELTHCPKCGASLSPGLIARIFGWLFPKPIPLDTPACPFCGQVMTQNQDTAAREACLCLYPLWRCSCGAIGSGEWPPDVDEVADQLLEILGIDTREPACGSR